MKPAKLTAMLIAIAVFYSAAADADEINCTYIVTHVHSYIVKPRRSGMSQQAVLARIAGSDLSALEKRWLNEFTRVAYAYEKKIGGIPIMSWAEHNCIKKRKDPSIKVDMALPWEKYGEFIIGCGITGNIASQAAVARDRGIAADEFRSSIRDSSDSREIADFQELGVLYAYEKEPHTPSSILMGNAVTACMDIAIKD